MRKFVYVLMICALATGCASSGMGIQSSVTASNPDVSTYKTYRLEPLGNVPASYVRAIESQITEVLASKGYVATAQPELLVRFNPVVDDRLELREVPTSPVYVGYRRRGVFVEGYTTEMIDVTEGSMFIAFVDANTEELLWEAVVHGKMNKGNPRRNRARIDTAITKMLEALPASAR